MNTKVYDNVFRTMLERMPELIIPVINEVFHTDYKKDETITQLRNEHRNKDGEIITDSCLQIRNNIYHIECQSTEDSGMTIRMVEYDFMVALENATREHGKYVLDFPDSCVVYIRNLEKGKMYLSADIKIGENVVPYRIPIVRVSDFARDEIFSKRLLFFLPYYIMRYEDDLKREGFLVDNLVAEYEEVLVELENATHDQEQKVARYLIELMQEVFDHVLRNHDSARERMDALMNGKVLHLGTDKILDEGRAEGRAEGFDKKGIDVYLNMLRRGYSEAEAISIADISDETLNKARDAWKNEQIKK